MRDMMNQAQLIVVVSHDLDSLTKVCDRCIWMDQGRIVQQGSAGAVIAAYTDGVRRAAA
jgi:ABC-type polysaccharide/polyol phosphate transport system ATPase subunit